MKHNYFAIYRCPMCNQDFRIAENPKEIEYDELPSLITRIVANQCLIYWAQVFDGHIIHIPHQCQNGDVGIAHLIGFKKV